MSAPTACGASATRVVIGIGELAVSGRDTSIVTHALGSCVAVCLWDRVSRVGGMVHLLLPDSQINPARAERQPEAFADTGIPLLFRRAGAYGLEASRAAVTLVGGADISHEAPDGVLNVGRRNILAARRLLWSHGVLIRAEDVGGRRARTVALFAQDGRVVVTTAGEPARVL